MVSYSEVKVSLESEKKKQLKQIAGRFGMKISQYLRFLAYAELNKTQIPTQS